MATAVVRVQTPEEREYARFLTQVEARRRRVADLRAEIETLKRELARFDAEYHAHVGRRFIELDQVRLAIDEYERRIAWLKWHPDADPAAMEQEIREAFAKRKQELEAAAEEARRRAEEQERLRPPLDPDLAAELRQRYRDLAKRFHPDLARTDEERSQRERIMQRVNASFQERDLAALREMESAADVDDPAFEARSIGDKLVWAIREIARLDDLIIRLEAELAAIRSTETWQLWHRHEQGEDVIGSLTANLNEAIAAARACLTTLIATYRDLLRQREEQTA